MARDAFRNIGLVARSRSEQALYSIRQLIHLLQARGCHVVVEKSLLAALEAPELQGGSTKQIRSCCDLVIVVGGDGSLLGAGRAFAGSDVPLLGVNRGRLGFLTDILPSEMETRVNQVLDGNYEVEYRFLLDMQVRREGTLLTQGSALNDVVLLSGDSVHMVEFELFIDNLFVYKQRSDGLIISTPTGSTAYALAGGGPIMHPRLDAVVLVPLNPHTLTSRPLVVDANSDIRLRVTTHRLNPLVSCDGQDGFRVQLNDEIRITKLPQRLKLLHPPGHNFYEACRSKLGWSNRLGEQ